MLDFRFWHLAHATAEIHQADRRCGAHLLHTPGCRTGFSMRYTHDSRTEVHPGAAIRYEAQAISIPLFDG